MVVRDDDVDAEDALCILIFTFVCLAAIAAGDAGGAGFIDEEEAKDEEEEEEWGGGSRCDASLFFVERSPPSRSRNEASGKSLSTHDWRFASLTHLLS